MLNVIDRIPRRRMALRIVAFCVSVLPALAGCRKSDAAKVERGPAPVPVTLAPVHTDSVQRSVEVVGTLWGEEDAVISNKVNGKVIAIYKDVGDRAEPGEPLAQLLKNDYILDVNQKQSALAEVLAKLGVKDLPPPDFDVSTLPAVRRARLQTKNAESKYNRGKQLHDASPPLMSEQEFTDLETALDVAKSGYEVEVLTARGLLGEVRTRFADLQIALQALDDTTVRAPREKYDAPQMLVASQDLPASIATAATRPAIASTSDTVAMAEAFAEVATAPKVAPSAQAPPATRPATAPSTRPAKLRHSYVVAARMASEGELEKAVTPLFRLVDDDPLKLRSAVPERYFRDIAVGQKVSLTIEAYPDTFTGEVSRINPQIDPANRTFPVEILIPNHDPTHRLPPGAFARASIKTHIQSGVVFVPLEAVISFAGVDKVFTIKDGKAQEIPIELGDRRGNDVEVTRGLSGNERVAVSGISRLATGVAVTVKQEPETKK
jgi:multidrug efflux pump subunit AcrA (membrane-fusion protein)